MDDGRRARLAGWRVGAAFIAFLFLIYLLRYVLLPFVVAAALAYIANPALVWLKRRWGFPRLLAGGLVFVVLVAALFAFWAWAGAILVRDVSQIAVELPSLLDKAFGQLLGNQEAPALGHTLTAAELTRETMSALQALFGSAYYVALAAGFGLASIMGTALTLVLLFYFLVSGDRLALGALDLVPPDQRDEVRRLAVRLDPALGRYLRGLAVVVLYAVLASWIGLTFGLRLQHSVLLAILTGLLELIPFIGPITAMIIVGIVVLQQGSVWLALGFGVYLMALRLSIDQLVGPLVLGRAATLHPTVIIFAFLAGGSLFGAVGLILAVPVAVSVKILLEAYYEGAYPRR